MTQNYLKTTMLDNQILIAIITLENMLKLSGGSLDNEDIIEMEEVDVYKKSIRKRRLINPSIFIHINTNDDFNEEELINNLIKGNVTDVCDVEVLFGIEMIKALKVEDNIDLIVNIAINLDKVDKESLFDYLNKSINGKVKINKKLELNLLDDESIFLYKVLKNINTLEKSPLKDRINFKGEKLSYKLNPKSLISCIQASNVLKLINNDEETLAKVIINTLLAYDISYREIYTSKKTPKLKICDFRYVVSLLPAFYEFAKFNKKALTQENIFEMFELIKKGDSDILNGYLNSINSESSTKALAKKHSRILMQTTAYCYDPMENI